MKKILLLLIAFTAVLNTSAQTKAAGVSIPSSLNYGEELTLNGVGVREKFWMDMYAGALYLKNKSHDATAIMNSNEPMAIRLHIVSGLISSDKMIDAVDEGFENSTHGKTDAIKDEIKKFKGFFSDKIKKNDVFDIVYMPSEGVVVFKNKKKLVYVSI